MKVPNYAEQLQPHVPEPLVAVGFLSKDEYASRKRRPPRKFPNNVIVGLTPASMYLFDFKPGYRGLKKVKPPVAVWDRRTFYTTVEGGLLGSGVRFIFNDGTELDLMYLKMPGMGDHNADFLQHLSGRPPAYPPTS